MNLQQKIIIELQKNELPDFDFLFSPEVLEVALEVLKELLTYEKQNFNKIAEKKNQDIVFNNFITKKDYSYFFEIIQFGKLVSGKKEFNSIIEEFEPILTDFNNSCLFNNNYYEKMKYALSNLSLNSDQKRILELRIKKYEHNGVHKDIETKKQLNTLNIELTKLSNRFQNNTIQSKSHFSLHFENTFSLKGIPQQVLDIGKKAAESKGLGGYIFDDNPNTYVAIMKYCESKIVRKQFFDARHQFASSGKYDNREIILRILKLREKRAKLLGYQSHAEYTLQNRMAKTPETVLNFIEGISLKAKKKLIEEIEILKKHFGMKTIDVEDVEYYATKYKELKYAINEEQLKEFFEYNNVLGFMLEFAKEFYQLDFKTVNIPLPYKEMSMYEVYKNDELISYYLLDPFFRKGKKAGAWAATVREKFMNRVPLITNCCNFQNSIPSLLSKESISTLFHEFGHALHEMLSESSYAELSGFGVAWDFVELPSQIHENWATNPESLKRFAHHYQTGEALPQKTIDVLSNLNTFMSGHYTLRQNEFALVDICLHTSPTPETIEELDQNVLKIVNKFGYFPKGDDYKAYASFSHFFYSGYDAGYYSYMWAEILEADVFAKIKELGMFNPEVGKHFLETILGQGCRKPESELFKDFMGSDLDNTPFMRKKGLM